MFKVWLFNFKNWSYYYHHFWREKTKVRVRKQAGILGLATPANAHNWYFSVLILHQVLNWWVWVKPKGVSIIKKHHFTQWILLTWGNKYITHLEGPLIKVSPCQSPRSPGADSPPLSTFKRHNHSEVPAGGVWSSLEHSFTCFSGDRPDTAM